MYGVYYKLFILSVMILIRTVKKHTVSNLCMVRYVCIVVRDVQPVRMTCCVMCDSVDTLCVNFYYLPSVFHEAETFTWCWSRCTDEEFSLKSAKVLFFASRQSMRRAQKGLRFYRCVSPSNELRCSSLANWGKKLYIDPWLMKLMTAMRIFIWIE